MSDNTGASRSGIETPDLPAGQTRDGAASVLARRAERMALLAILVLALALRMWGIEQNGWGAEYYTAAVRSMAANWHNFFYTAFDPQGFISVDKPPIALWIQVASVKLFGFHPLSVLLPQALEGAVSVWIMFHLVRRRFSALAALLAALFLAITPVVVAVNRANNTDSCLLLALLLAAWALMKAAEEGNRRLLMLSMALIGLAFNIKMLAAFIVLPTMYLVYFVGAPKRWQACLADLALASVVLMATALPWVLAYELTPAEQRPYVGGSSNNSMLELLVGHNGIGRFVSRTKPSAIAQNESARTQSAGAAVPAATDSDGGAEARPRSAARRLFVSAPAGPLRFADGHLLAQLAWLLPLALMSLADGAFKGGLRRPLAPVQLALFFWFCWIVDYAVVYSYAGGIMHFYYLSTMAPALAALAGIGVANLWLAYRGNDSRAILLPATLLVTAAWQLYVQVDALGWTWADLRRPPGNWQNGLHAGLVCGVLVAAAGLIACLFRQGRQGANRGAQILARGALGLGLSALLLLPAAWALSSVLIAGYGVLPSADLYRLDPLVRSAGARVRGNFGRSLDTSKLVGFLRANRRGERYLLATSTTQLAAPIIIETGEEVMARGGYHGLNPAMTPEKLARMVETGEIRYAALGDVSPLFQRMGADAAGRANADWIRANGRPVPLRLWRSRGLPRGMELYDLAPKTG